MSYAEPDSRLMLRLGPGKVFEEVGEEMHPGLIGAVSAK